MPASLAPRPVLGVHRSVELAEHDLLAGRSQSERSGTRWLSLRGSVSAGSPARRGEIGPYDHAPRRPSATRRPPLGSECPALTHRRPLVRFASWPVLPQPGGHFGDCEERQSDS
jgi:hypothetical protein